MDPPSTSPDYDFGWKLWTDMVRYYPSAVHRRRTIVDWILPLAPESVLDVGCGPAQVITDLHAALPDTRYTGVDQAGVVLEMDRERCPWARFFPLDVAKDRVGEQFAAVICSEVLEHVPDDETALANLARMTERHLLITVPSGPIYPLERSFGHLRHYQLEPLCRRIEAHGLSIARAEAWGFPWMSLFKLAANLRPKATMDRFGAGTWSLPARAVGAGLTGLFHFNLKGRGPQLFVLARRAQEHQAHKD